MYTELNEYERNLLEYIENQKKIDINDDFFKIQYQILCRKLELEESNLGLEIESRFFVNSFNYSQYLYQILKEGFKEEIKLKVQSQMQQLKQNQYNYLQAVIRKSINEKDKELGEKALAHFEKLLKL